MNAWQLLSLSASVARGGSYMNHVEGHEESFSRIKVRRSNVCFLRLSEVLSSTAAHPVYFYVHDALGGY